MNVRIKPVEDVVASQLDALMTLADRTWREQLEEAALAHETVTAAWRLESARVAARFGAESARAKTASIRVAAHTAARAELDAERDRLKTPSPRPQTGSAVLHGRVTDLGGKAVSGLTVRIVNEAGKKIATARTTASGGYRVTLPLTNETQVFMEIDGPRGARLHQDEQPTIAAPGGMLFREIVVDAGAVRRSGKARRRRSGNQRQTRRRKHR